MSRIWIALALLLVIVVLLTGSVAFGLHRGAMLNVLLFCGGAVAFGAVKVKDAGASATKFANRASAAAGDYAAGVQGAGQSWQQNTAASGDAYAQGVTAAISRKAFEGGVAKAGAAKYTANAAGKGAQRYPQGVSAAGPAWQAAVGKYLQVIAGLTLNPRRPKGDPANLTRVQQVTQALRSAKLSS